MMRVAWRSKRFRLGLLLAIGVAVLAGAGWLWHDFTRFVRAPLQVATAGETVDIARGTGFKDIVGQLHRQHLTSAPAWYWRALALRLGVVGKLHAGEYAAPPGITPRELLANMASGKVLQRNFTIVDGWTFRELLAALGRADKLQHATTTMDAAAIMRAIGASGDAPEGWFLPETYAYVKGDSDLDILRRAHGAMVKLLAQMWPARAQGLPLATPYDALIFASIVEKETGRADERAKIAGVFVRRLEDHMLLQTDPSVIYGMGERYQGKIRKVDLTTDTPYNTYTRAGLPPTPIALPGKPALEAALHPQSGTALYFVARGDGTHVFADTLAEQNRNVACYQLKRCSHD
ncbi:MAG: endolytic transglycosylase MltG [Rhodanobacter sp.]|nr:MAG: endolytic transglycosylase MltG [Rhodanobacter sp.]TAM14674.1 MAG: endolytic transglycosylase MltG [Rhodanobacter sp.]TAM37466.1 MAG: endolytic transglycosylase MltG [Rhodanobacter sp.]